MQFPIICSLHIQGGLGKNLKWRLWWSGQCWTWRPKSSLDPDIAACSSWDPKWRTYLCRMNFLCKMGLDLSNSHNCLCWNKSQNVNAIKNDLLKIVCSLCDDRVGGHPTWCDSKVMAYFTTLTWRPTTLKCSVKTRVMCILSTSEYPTSYTINGI